MTKYPATMTWRALKHLGTGFDMDKLNGGSGHYSVTTPTNGPGTGTWAVTVHVTGDNPRKVVQDATNVATGVKSNRVHDGSAWSAWGVGQAAAGITVDPTAMDNTEATDLQTVLEDFDAAITAAAA